MMIIPPRPWHSLALLLVTFITPSFGQAADAPLILRADVLLPGYSKPQPVSYEVRDGLAIFEGDIILGEVDGSGYLLPAENDINADAVATNQERYRWPDGVVPYEIDLCTSSSDTDCVTAAGEQNIKLAIDHWNNSTPIQLVERDPALHRHYVRFVRGTVKNACFSKIGRQLGEQKIQLTSDGDCHWVTLVHEIGHTVGLYHEHTREDRDDYVQIRWDNIDPKRKGDFEKRVHVSADSGAYDYYSVMHYDRFSFCKKTTAGACVGPTIDAPPGIPIGQTNSLSTGDLTAVSALYSFQPVVTQSTPVRCATTEICVSADVSGDGRDDLITFVRDGNPIPITPPIPDAQQGDVLVARAKSDGSGFESRSKWHESFCLGNDVCKVADVNGDGRGDLVAFKRTGEVQVARALIWGTFGPAQTWATQFCERPEEICDTGDFNGDGDADIVKFHHGAWNGSSQVYVYLSDGSTGFYYPGSPWANGFCMQAAEVCTTGDFNRDGRDDIITFHHGAWNGSNHVFVYLSNGASFYYPGAPWHTDFCDATQTCAVGDVSGDGRDDIIAFEGSVPSHPYPPGTTSSAPTLLPDSGDVYVALGIGGTFGDKWLRHGDFCHEIGKTACFMGDMDGDGRKDLLWAPIRETLWTTPQSDTVRFAKSQIY